MTSALILDLKRSRSYSDIKRNDIQQYLVRITDHMNRIFSASLLKDLRLNGGDELQGLFCDAESTYLCLRLFERALHTITFHAGIGIGEWTTVVEDKDTYYQDGPVYHRARRAVELAKKETEYTAMICSETKRDPVLNAMLNSGFRFMQKNSAYQNELAILMECRYPIQPKNPLDLDALAELPTLIKNNMQNQKENISLHERVDLSGFATQGKPAQPLEELKMPIVASENTHSSSDDLIFQAGHPFRAASELADYTGLKRQAIHKSLHNADIFTERSIAMAMITELCETQSEIFHDKEGK